MPSPIRIFITGGTFDKEYNMITGQLFFDDTHLPEMLETGRCNLDVRFRTLMMVDSLEMSDEDRNTIATNCEKCDERKIVITHGTDTMTKTAEVIAKRNLDKTVVITGAMIPFQFGTSSDGFFNLGSALAFSQSLESGVYVAMNGRYFKWNAVRKNRKTGFFEEIE